MSESASDEEFKLDTNANTTFYGGDPTFADMKKLDKWVMSIDQNLYPLNATFEGIWTLVDDPVKSATMKKFMMEYINEHNTQN